MKVLAVSNLYPPNVVGGYEVLCFDVMQALAQRGINVSVLCSDYGTAAANFPDHQVHRDLKLLATPGNIYAPFEADSAQRQKINQHNIDTFSDSVTTLQPDLLFVWNLHFFDVSLLKQIEEVNIPVVYLLTDNWFAAFHNPDFIAQYFSTQVYVSAPQAHAKIKQLLHRCRGLFGTIRQRFRSERPLNGAAIFPSRFMREFYQHAGITFAHDTIIPHGIKKTAGASQKPTSRSGELCNQRELKLLFAGRIVEIKGVHTIIQALPDIIENLPEYAVTLSVVGDSQDQSYTARLHERIESLNLAGHVEFSPSVSESALVDLFNEHDIYLFPSLYEPFSLTLIHALRAGIPTVASRAGGTPEIVIHNQTGLLFDPADADDLAGHVVSLASDPHLRAQLSLKGSEYAQTFTFERMIEKIAEYLFDIEAENK
jgi:glycosyltransferase involved in cell wall biosynthesis